MGAGECQRRRRVTSSVSGATHALVDRHLSKLLASSVPKSRIKPAPSPRGTKDSNGSDTVLHFAAMSDCSAVFAAIQPRPVNWCSYRPRNGHRHGYPDAVSDPKALLTYHSSACLGVAHLPGAASFTLPSRRTTRTRLLRPFSSRCGSAAFLPRSRVGGIRRWQSAWPFLDGSRGPCS
jgi:hypothetical protein